MSFRTTLFLLAAALGLGAYLYFVEVPKATEETKKKTLLELKTDDVTALTLDYSDRTIALEKRQDAWRLTKPVDALADETATRNLLNAIVQCEVNKEIDNPGTDRSAYGLDSPFVTVSIRLGDRMLPKIVVGKNTPVGSSAYVSRDDDNKIRLTSSSFRSGLDKDVKDLRDKTILRFSDDDVRQIGIHGERQNLLLSRKDGEWTIDEPSHHVADAATLRSYLSTLRSMRAVDFPSAETEDLAPFGLDSPRLAVTLHLAEGDKQTTLLVGKENEKKEVFVKTAEQPTIYTVNEWVFRDVDKSLKDFRDKTVLPFDKDSARRLDIKRADGTITALVRGGGEKWGVQGAGEGQSDDSKISQFLGDLRDLKGYDIVADQPADLQQFGLAEPLLSITVSGADDAKLGVVLLGKYDPEPGKTEGTAMAADGKTVFLLREYLFTRLDKQEKDFLKQPTPPAAPPAMETGGGEEDTAEDIIDDEFDAEE